MNLHDEETCHGEDVPYWVSGVPCATHEEACIVAGADTPAQVAAEESWIDLELSMTGRHPYAHHGEAPVIPSPLRQPVHAIYCTCTCVGASSVQPFPF